MRHGRLIITPDGTVKEEEGFEQPVINRQVGLYLCVGFSSLTGHTNSAAELNSARTDDAGVDGVAAHFELLSLRMVLFLFPTLFLAFSSCALYDNIRFSVTPRYTGWLSIHGSVHTIPADVELFAKFAVPQVKEADLRLCGMPVSRFEFTDELSL